MIESIMYIDFFLLQSYGAIPYKCILIDHIRDYTCYNWLLKTAMSRFTCSELTKHLLQGIYTHCHLALVLPLNHSILFEVVKRAAAHQRHRTSVVLFDVRSSKQTRRLNTCQWSCHSTAQAITKCDLSDKDAYTHNDGSVYQKHKK